MGQGLSNRARSAGKHALRKTAEVGRAERRTRRRHPPAARINPSEAPQRNENEGNLEESPVDRTQHKKSSSGPDVFSINKDAEMVSAGPWTVGDGPVTDELVEAVQAKDDALVKLMSELPEIKMSVPKESVGSRKIHRSLPQDRSSHPRTKASSPAMFDGTLNSGQILEMLSLFEKGSQDTAAERYLLSLHLLTYLSLSLFV